MEGDATVNTDKMEQISMAFSGSIQNDLEELELIQRLEALNLIHSNLNPYVNSTVQALMSTLATLVPKDWSFSLYPGP